MRINGFTFGARSRTGPNRPAGRGVTFIELMVVLAIITIFSVMLISGYRRFQSGFRASSALSRVESALNYARNLAIANNAVYHVRFETCDTIPNSDTFNTILPDQAVGIYCFPAMSNALGITQESQVQHWNMFPSLSNSNGTFDNCLIEKTMLPQGTYYGIQWLAPTQAPYDKVLFFRPDGTASGALTIFVTDEIEFADNRALSESEFNALQDKRRQFFNNRLWVTQSKQKQPPWLRMIQIFAGGMIKQRAVPSPTGNQL